MSTEFIELAGKINQQMPYHCVERIELALNDVAKPIKGSKIAILGVAYKGGIGDIRESPALRIIEVLLDRGAELVYHDPYRAGAAQAGAEEHRSWTRRSRAPTRSCSSPPTRASTISQIAGQASLFVDLRGITRGLDGENLVRL